MKNWIYKLFIKYFVKKHKFPPGILIHHNKGKVVFEIEVNWYDETFHPVSVVREVKSGKMASIRYDEMKEFKEYAGSDPNAGYSI